MQIGSDLKLSSFVKLKTQKTVVVKSGTVEMLEIKSDQSEKSSTVPKKVVLPPKAKKRTSCAIRVP